MSNLPVHRSWCDETHPYAVGVECSAEVGRIDEISVMVYGPPKEDRGDVAICGADGTSMLSLPAWKIARLASLLSRGANMVRG